MKSTTPPQNRYIELDLLRTAAIVMMVIYHFVFNGVYFFGVDLDPLHGFWRIFARTSAITFLLLVGISFTISWQKQKTKHFLIAYDKYLVRGGIIIGFGMLITVITYALIPIAYVRFGILHLIGTCILLLPFTAKLRETNLLLGIAVILIGMLMKPLHTDLSFLLPLGFHDGNLNSVDYFPLLPWYGFVLIGAGMGSYLYVRNVHWRRQILPIPKIVAQILTWPGRHSLLIYMTHQPLVLLALWLVL